MCTVSGHYVRLSFVFAGTRIYAQTRSRPLFHPLSKGPAEPALGHFDHVTPQEKMQLM